MGESLYHFEVMYRIFLCTAIVLSYGVSGADGGMILSSNVEDLRLELSFDDGQRAAALDDASSTSAESSSINWVFADNAGVLVLTLVEGEGTSMSGLVPPLLVGVGLAATSNSIWMDAPLALIDRVVLSNSVLPRSPVLDGLIKPS